MPAPTKEWLAEQYYSGRMNIPRAHYHVFSEDQHESLAEAFKRIAVNLSGELRLEMPSLVNRIQSQLPAGFPEAFANNVYRILAYHSTAPFYQDPYSALPESLALLDVQRALAWLLPDGHLRMSETGNMGRMRTPADRRRLLFQSLATCSISSVEHPDSESVRQNYARCNAYDAEHAMKEYGFTGEDVDEALSDWCKPNRDNDGDEMYHDLLDVLHSNVPDNFPFGSRRDDLRPLARDLRSETRFHELAIPRVELESLVQELLALQFRSTWSSSHPVDLETLDGPTASIMNAFICNDTELADAYPQGHDIVSWPAFDHGVKQCAHLFNPVYRLLIDTLLDGETDLWHLPAWESHEMPRTLLAREDIPTTPSILSYGWMMMMPGILPAIVDWEFLHTAISWRLLQGAHEEQVPPTSDNVWAHIRAQTITDNLSLPTTVILALEGRDLVSGEQYKGGVMVAADYDGDGGRTLMYNLYCFQIAPSVYCSKIPGGQWRQTTNGTLTFAIDKLSSGFNLNVDEMVVEIDMPYVSRAQRVQLNALEVWEDSGR